jgi:phospholipase C
MRRFLALSSLVLCACGQSVDDNTTTAGVTTGGGPLPGPAEWNKQVTPPSDAAAAEARQKCQYKAGMLPAETQGASHPMGAAIPIDHILIVMMENRSFDHYFQKLPEYGVKDAEVAPADFSNLDGAGMPVKIYHRNDTPPDKAPAYCFVDTSHGYNPVHAQYNDGKMDGFVTSNEGDHDIPVHGTQEMMSGARAMGYYDQTDLPFYYWLASEFTIADHYHCSVLGPTAPNRMFMLAATSFGTATLTLLDPDKTLADYVSMRELDWKTYASATPDYGYFISKFFKAKQEGHIKNIDDFFTDVAAGTLPALSYVQPELAQDFYDANDEHPPHNAQQGQLFVAKVVDAVAKSPLWARSAIFITYDEHGGLYDHVPPPPACAPDSVPPVPFDGGTKAEFTRLGIRVPMMVVSPYAKKHFVAHHTYDHTSIIRFVESRFVIPALTNRDANAEAPWEMFDFDHPPHLEPPKITLPTVDAKRLADCAKVFKP